MREKTRGPKWLKCDAVDVGLDYLGLCIRLRIRIRIYSTSNYSTHYSYVHYSISHAPWKSLVLPLKQPSISETCHANFGPRTTTNLQYYISRKVVAADVQNNAMAFVQSFKSHAYFPAPTITHTLS